MLVMVAQVTPFLTMSKYVKLKNINKYRINYFKLMNSKYKRLYKKSKTRQVSGCSKSVYGSGLSFFILDYLSASALMETINTK
jgi:uncharacterized membrane protein YwzB